jgi:RTX calcium-binding nonapeptide repeat (4 copies)
MRFPRPLNLLALGLLMLILVSVLTAVAATNTVPASHLATNIFPIGPNELKPSACAGIYLTDIVTGSGVINGTSGNDLILGGPGADSINGNGGDDCCVGGGGDNTFTACAVQIP